MPLQDQLFAYFELDQRVRAMRARLDAALRRKTAQERKLAQLKQAADELNTQVRTVQARAMTLEKEAASIDQRINTQREKMNSVTSNKEYSALLVEVNTLKADKSKIDDAQLDLMGKIEKLKAEAGEVNERVASQQKLVDGATQEASEAQTEVGGKLTELTADRDAAAKPLSDDIRKTFDRLSDTYDGEAMAEISEQDRRRREYTCGGCFTLLPVESVNALITKPDQITACGTCQRILYVGQELRQSLADAKS